MTFCAGLAGCACPSSNCGVPGTPCAPCANELVVVEDDLPDLTEPFECQCELIPLPTPTETFQLLDASTCQCNAATNAPIANMVELERHWAKVTIECDTKNVRENLCMDRDLLALHVADHRNSAAASALKAFYQLAGLEAQKRYLRLGIDESHQTLGRVDKLLDKGLAVPEGVDRTTVATRLQELEDQQLQLDFSRIQLNGQLQKLIGCPLDEYSFYWPQMGWQPDLTPVDVEGALAQGLSTRPDLRGLSLVLCNLEKVTLTVARGILKFADSTIGTVEPRDGVLHTLRCFRCNSHEVPVRCRQLAIFYQHTEQGAIAEIKNAAYKISLQQQRVVLAQQKVQRLQERLYELTETRDVNDVSIFELSNLRGRIYEAQSDLIQKVAALKIADVELLKSQGMLAVECGYAPVLCLEGCCDGACSKSAGCRCSCRACKKQSCSRCK